MTPEKRAEMMEAVEHCVEYCTDEEFEGLIRFGLRLLNNDRTVELLAMALAAGQIDSGQFELAKRLALLENEPLLAERIGVATRH